MSPSLRSCGEYLDELPVCQGNYWTEAKHTSRAWVDSGRPTVEFGAVQPSSGSSLLISPVSVHEAVQYARVAAETFFEAYRDSAEPANMAAHLAREFGERQQIAELSDPACTVLAAREPDGDWAGFAALRSNARAAGVESASHPIEVARFYTRSRWHGRGIAAQLMDAACDWGRVRGHDVVWLQVWEHNTRARRFYEKCGFVAVGTNPFLFGEEWEDDIVYARALVPDVAS